MMEQKERQELHCHSCDSYVQFDIDLSLDGNHVLNCPICGHEHCRVVKRGKITDDRWDQRNGYINTYYVSNVSTTVNSTYTSYSTVGAGIGNYMYTAWLNTTS